MNVRTPAMSVVVPTIGRVRALRGCLQALASSDYARDRFEVLVANDGGGTPVETLVGEFAGGMQGTRREVDTHERRPHPERHE